MSLTVVTLLLAAWFALPMRGGSVQGTPSLFGEWTNANKTVGLTKVSVKRIGGMFSALAWASCHPTDCEWGEQPLLVFSPHDHAGLIDAAIGEWDLKAAKHTVILRLEVDHMVIEDYAVSKAGKVNTHDRYIFVNAQ